MNNKKFTFKTERVAGSYAGFYPDYIYIKHNKIKVGNIDSKKPYGISLKIYKKDIMENGNPNCEWRWAHFKKEFESVDAAEAWLNDNREEIFKLYKIYYQE
jgi:hypothetical protein